MHLTYRSYMPEQQDTDYPGNSAFFLRKIHRMAVKWLIVNINVTGCGKSRTFSLLFTGINKTKWSTGG